MRAKGKKTAPSAAIAAPPGGVREARAGYVTIPTAKYRAMLSRIEDLEDTRLLRAAEAAAATRVYLPLDLVKRMNAGEHPVRVWRGFRGLTLAAKAKIPAGYLSEIETGKKPARRARSRRSPRRSARRSTICFPDHHAKNRAFILAT